jgi:hypothetical protein
MKSVSGRAGLGLSIHGTFTKKPTVFVSYTYRDRDNPLLMRMLSDLNEKAGVKTWVAEERLHNGMPLMQSLGKAIEGADYFVRALSTRSARSLWMDPEMQFAYTRQLQTLEYKIVTVLLEPLPVPSEIEGYSWVNLYQDYETGFAALLSAIGLPSQPLLVKFDIDRIHRGQTILEVTNGVGRAVIERLSKHPEELRTLDRRLFEEFVAEIFHGFGYEVELTKRTRDGGRDVIAIRDAETAVRYLIECKRPDPGRPLGVGAVRNLYGVLKDEQATKGILATTAFFTRDARLFFDRHRWELEPKDYDGLLRWIEMYRRQKGSA